MKVAVIMGSKSDYPKLEDGIKLLERFGVEVSVRALSAHRTPKQLVSFLEEIDLTSPKSQSFIVQFELTKIFEGFKSLWMINPVCRYFKALVIW